MEWLNAWDSLAYPVGIDIDGVDPSLDSGLPTTWLVVAVILSVAAVVWYRQRVVRHSFWCATAGRDVELVLERGRVLSCTAFEDSTAVACARHCRDRSFRMQWPAAVPELSQLRGGRSR